jgi:hypothetical protein
MAQRALGEEDFSPSLIPRNRDTTGRRASDAEAQLVVGKNEKL